MSNSLIYLARTTLKNTFKQILKKPLKLLGYTLIIAYFAYLPFMSQSMLDAYNLNTPTWFVLFTVVLTLYISMPATLSYFKRKGVIFRKQDINFIFATPTSPKQALLYALLKQAVISFFMQFVFIIAAIFIFHIPVLKALIYGISSILFSSMTQYSLAVIMYASEQLSLNFKKWIRWIVYIFLVCVTGFAAYFILQNGASVDTVTQLISHPFILMVPIFGWDIGWLNLIILGPTPISIIASVLYVASALALTWYAYTMPCKGDYYEDALAFSERQAILDSKKGNLTFKEAISAGKKKHVRISGVLSGNGSQVIFFKQILERRRSTRFFLQFSDLLYLIAGVGIGILSLNADFEIPPELFFSVVCGVTMYLTLFFSPAPTWKDEFNQPSLYTIPDPISHKLLYATLFDHCIALLRAIMLTLPSGILIGASPLDIILAIIAQVLIRAVITYVSVITREYLGVKVGANVSQFVNIIVNMIVLIVPTIAVVISITTSSFLGFGIITTYSIIMIVLFLKISEKILTNIESLRS